MPDLDVHLAAVVSEAIGIGNVVDLQVQPPGSGAGPPVRAAHEEYLVADLTDQRGETGRIERRLWERHPRKPIGTGKVRRIAAVGPSAVRADGQRFACFQVHPGIHPRFLGIHRYRSDGL